MKINIIIVTLILFVFTTACGMFGTKTEEANTVKENKTEETTKNDEKTEDKDKEEEKFTGEVKFPFDFPATATTAKEGDTILVPSYNWITEALQKDPSKVTFIWYNQKMEKPGDEKSMVKYLFEKEPLEVPNAYIIPIPKGGTAQKGDIVLTWWQSGSGMNRAIVVDDSTPTEPVIKYLDIAYDNPAKSRDKTTTIGKMEEKLKPDSFVVIKNELEPGTSVAIKDGNREKHGQVIRAEGDKVFVRMFAGRVGVFPKSDTTAVPVKPALKAGDKVKAPFVGSFSPATVTKVDNAAGRVWIKYESGSTDEKVVSIGDILPN